MAVIMEDVKTQNDTFTNLERLEELITYWPQVVVNRINPPDPVNQPDNVNHPSHYTAYNGLEIIDLTEQMNFNRGNAVKYIARAGLKGAGDKEIEDLEKAAWYINREIQRLRDESSSRVIDRTSHSEDTLARVYAVMQKECGLDSNSAERVVLSLLNKGILFRERV